MRIYSTPIPDTKVIESVQFIPYSSRLLCLSSCVQTANLRPCNYPYKWELIEEKHVHVCIPWSPLWILPPYWNSQLNFCSINPGCDAASTTVPTLTAKLNILSYDGQHTEWYTNIEDYHHDTLQHTEFKFSWFC